MIEHPWDITPTQAIALQRELAAKVLVCPIRRIVRTIAGTDCAMSRDGKDILAAAVLFDARTMEVLAAVHVRRPCEFPYVPGLLSFREAPATINAVRQLPQPPDLVMCDGQGLAHPRGLGLACHVGLWLDVPTIGVAKSRLCGQHAEPGPRRSSRTRLLLNGKVIGTVLRTRDGVKPLYISAGHRITLPEAAEWTLRTAHRYRLPEPTRQAHLYLKQIAE